MSPGTQASPNEAAAPMAAGARLQAMRRRVHLTRVAALTAIATGPVALCIALATHPATVEAATAAKPTVVRTGAAGAADPAGFAQLFVGAWLRSSADDATSAQARLAQSMAPHVYLPEPGYSSSTRKRTAFQASTAHPCSLLVGRGRGPRCSRRDAKSLRPGGLTTGLFQAGRRAPFSFRRGSRGGSPCWLRGAGSGLFVLDGTGIETRVHALHTTTQLTALHALLRAVPILAAPLTDILREVPSAPVRRPIQAAKHRINWLDTHHPTMAPPHSPPPICLPLPQRPNRGLHLLGRGPDHGRSQRSPGGCRISAAYARVGGPADRRVASRTIEFLDAASYPVQGWRGRR